MKILTASQIPTEIQDTPLNSPVKLYKICQEMRVACTLNQGKGLSAVQVGVPWKLFVVADLPKSLRIDGDSFGYFINCEYEPVGDHKTESIEGCLSILAEDQSFRRFRLNRHYNIRVRGKRLVDLQIQEFDQILDIKTDCIVFQHEIDHHNGILISDLGKEILLW
jgi:peptide deformylase